MHYHMPAYDASSQTFYHTIPHPTIHARTCINSKMRQELSSSNSRKGASRKEGRCKNHRVSLTQKRAWTSPLKALKSTPCPSRSCLPCNRSCRNQGSSWQSHVSWYQAGHSESCATCCFRFLLCKSSLGNRICSRIRNPCLSPQVPGLSLERRLFVVLPNPSRIGGTHQQRHTAPVCVRVHACACVCMRGRAWACIVYGVATTVHNVSERSTCICHTFFHATTPHHSKSTGERGLVWAKKARQ